MINLELKYSGELLNQNEINEILGNYRISKHAIERLNERSNILVENYRGVDFISTKINIRNDICNNLYLAYFNKDGSVNIAIDKFNYYVFKLLDNGCWLLQTFKEKSWNNITIDDKRKLAQKGVGGQYLQGGGNNVV